MMQFKQIFLKIVTNFCFPYLLKTNTQQSYLIKNLSVIKGFIADET